MYLRFTSSPEPIFDPREDVDNTISMFTGGRASRPSGLSGNPTSQPYTRRQFADGFSK